MNMKNTQIYALAIGISLSFGAPRVFGDDFGSGGNLFTIDFVTVGNAGNGNDLGLGGGIHSSPYGAVSYVFRMGVTEISQTMIDKAIGGGLTNVTAGAHSGDKPAANVTWYEAAAFVNWLNTSSGYQAAYNLNGSNTAMTLWTSGEAWQLGGENLYRHRDAVYFLPSDDEWYKSAYHKNDGVTSNYWDYATGTNSIPAAVASGTSSGTAVFNQPTLQGPANVLSSGGLNAYGTRGQNGNVLEWQESATDGVNSDPSEERIFSGAHWSTNNALNLRASGTDSPLASFTNVGFRVASIPEPTAAVLLMSGLFSLTARRGRRNTTQ
jgi:hypothetical protein